MELTLSAIFVLSFITALSGALIPGPLLTVTIAQTVRRGFIAAMLLIAGHSILELALVVGLWFGLGHVLQVKPVIGTIAVLGGAMLLWMGWGMLRDARRGSLDLNIERPTPNIQNPISSIQRPISGLLVVGMVVSLSNPYWTLWWATIGLTFFAALSSNAVSTVGVFYLGHIMGDIAWYVLIGLAVATGRKFINPGVYRRVVQVCGIFLAFLGASFLYLVVSGGLWTIRMSMVW